MTESSQPAATLTISSGLDAGKRFGIGTAPVTLGRHDQCDIQVQDRWMSRQHARIAWSGSGYVIEDLGSTNGTFVNGERITGPRALKSGDRLRLGDEVVLAFQAHLLQAAGAPRREAVAAKEVPFLRRKSTRIWALAVLSVLLILLVGGGVYYLFTDREEPAPGTPTGQAAVPPPTTATRTATPMSIPLTATPTPTLTPTATRIPTNTPTPVLPTNTPTFSHVISLGPGRFGKPLWLQVVKGEYKLVSGATLLPGSAIDVYEDWLTFPAGLAINVEEGEITLKGMTYPPGTKLVVNSQGGLEQR